jgi:transaldolase
MTLTDLSTKIFADGAELAGMLAMYREPHIKGFTTNPTLMRKAGLTDYRAFAKEVVAAIPDRPISFEVFSDEFADMERQAREIATWGDHVYVKIPVTNTRREPAYDLVHRLSHAGVKLNVTALMTLAQVQAVTDALQGGAPSNVSVFAGRIADTGRDPVPHMKAALEIMKAEPSAELIWASPRELLNVFQADAVGCHIITATNDILKKLDGVGKDLDRFSLETVEMFRRDAVAAGFQIGTSLKSVLR